MDSAHGAPTAPRMRPLSIVAEFAQGIRIGAAGWAAWKSSGRLMAWGIVPSVVAAALLSVVLVGGILGAFPVGGWVANELFLPGSLPHEGVRLVVAVAVVAAVVVVCVYTMTALTLAVGQPVYERISRTVDSPDPILNTLTPEPWWRALIRSISEWARLLLLTVPMAGAAFALGFIPVLGSVAGFTVSALLGGWILALELTAYPMSRRGVITLRDRRTALKPYRYRAIGFGVTVFLVFLIPGGAMVMMPAAAVGGTVLVRSLPMETMRRQP